MRQRIQTLLLDMIPVILGVLIALLINEWKADRDDQRFINKIMDAITQEILENQTDLKEVLVGHEALLDTIDLYLEDDTVNLGALIGKTGGLKAANIKNTAWRALLNSKLELIEYEQLSVLTGIDEKKQFMQIKLEKLIDFVYAHIEDNSIDKKALFRTLIDDLKLMEQNTLILYDNFLQFGAEKEQQPPGESPPETGDEGSQ
ncbi:MAG: hypothetical protein AAFW73_06320 [Bacteroidota bacterium]